MNPPPMLPVLLFVWLSYGNVIMEEILQRIGNVRIRYQSAMKQVAALHSDWDTSRDVRLTMFYKTANVLNCTKLGLVHLILNVADDAWWHQYVVPVPSQESRYEQAIEFDTFVRIGCLQGVFSTLESSLRQIVRALDATACGCGTAEFASIYRWLFKRTSLEKWDSLLDLLRCSRNTIHNNGVYFHRTGQDEHIKHNGQDYDFVYGKHITFVTWDFLLDRFDELVDLLQELASAPAVAACVGIFEPGTTK